MKNKKRIWTKEELTLAYYSARWDMQNISHTEDEIVHGVIGNTSVASFRMQVANFRYLLNIEGYQLDHTSQAMRDLCDEYDSLSREDVGMLVMAYIDAQTSDLSSYTKSSHNKRVNNRRDRLNAQSELIFQNKLAHMRKTRRLVKK